MGPLIVGIVLLIVHAYVLIPPPLDLLVLIAGVIAFLYGLWIIFVGFRGPVAPGPYHRRYWY